MKVVVQLFARARDLAGAPTLEVEVPAGATVADLRRILTSACPALASLLPRCAVAVGDDFAADDLPLGASAPIALLPPVSGG
jgi:molybdopterin converting factor subunit 1